MNDTVLTCTYVPELAKIVRRVKLLVGLCRQILINQFCQAGPETLEDETRPLDSTWVVTHCESHHMLPLWSWSWRHLDTHHARTRRRCRHIEPRLHTSCYGWRAEWTCASPWRARLGPGRPLQGRSGPAKDARARGGEQPVAGEGDVSV